MTQVVLQRPIAIIGTIVLWIWSGTVAIVALGAWLDSSRLAGALLLLSAIVTCPGAAALYGSYRSSWPLRIAAPLGLFIAGMMWFPPEPDTGAVNDAMNVPVLIGGIAVLIAGYWWGVFSERERVRRLSAGAVTLEPIIAGHASPTPAASTVELPRTSRFVPYAELATSEAETEPRRQRRAPRTRPPIVDIGVVSGDHGAGATFTYIDSDGVISEREVRNWSCDGARITGFCLSRRRSRTFRVDRISDWSTALSV